MTDQNYLTKREDMKRKDMKRKDRTAQMIGQVIQPIDERITDPSPTVIAEPRGATHVSAGQAFRSTYPSNTLHSTLSRVLGLSLVAPTTDISSDISTGFGTNFGTGITREPSAKTEPLIEPLKGPRYRITKLLSQEVGKRTFLATEECSQSQVIVKLLLFSPDLAEEEAALAEQQTTLSAYELPAHLPYLESFEASTPLGEGLVLIKSYAEVSTNSSQDLSQMPARHLSLVSNESSSTQMRRRSDSPVQQQTVQQQSASYTAPATVSTVHPQFAYKSIRINTTPQKLQVQFPESYVHTGLLASDIDSKTPTETVEMWLLTTLGTVVFVGGVVASTGSILAGIVVAALLPVLYRALVGPPTKRNRVAKLRVTSEPDGRAFISLTSMGKPTRDRTGRIHSSPTESKLHGSRHSIKSVKVSTTVMISSDINPLKAKLSFTFHNQNWHSQSLSIVGSYAEIRWLSHHLSEWGRARTGR